jgi:hypothetical protein
MEKGFVFFMARARNNGKDRAAGFSVTKAPTPSTGSSPGAAVGTYETLNMPRAFAGFSGHSTMAVAKEDAVGRTVASGSGSGTSYAHSKTPPSRTKVCVTAASNPAPKE